jgi:hypothetical protein
MIVPMCSVNGMPSGRHGQSHSWLRIPTGMVVCLMQHDYSAPIFFAVIISRALDTTGRGARNDPLESQSRD